MQRPPIVEDALEGAPGTSSDDFKHPVLRRFPRYGSEVKWLEYLGQGEEGIVFKATIGGGETVAVKVFWHTQRPAPQPRYNGIMHQLEWPFEEECRTVALVEKMRWAMQYVQGDPEKQSICLDRKPKTRHDAFKLLLAFSDERRQQPPTKHGVATPPPAFPPVTACHGWMTVRRDTLPRIKPRLWREVDEQVDWHWAIVYDFIPAEPEDVAVRQAHLDFFYAVGFTFEAYKFDNWRGGRLVDFGDVCSPLTRGWTPPYPPVDLRARLNTSGSPQPTVGQTTVVTRS